MRGIKGWKNYIRKMYCRRHHKNGQYYSKDEIKVGMWVAVADLDRITNLRILLDRASFIPDADVIGYGKIVFIGNESYLEKGIKPRDVIVIFHCWDLTDESISIEYDR